MQSIMDDLSISFPVTSFQPSSSSFRRVLLTENKSYPILDLAPNTLHMRVKEGSKIHNLLRIATARIHDGIRQVVFTGSGRGITKTITCVEILKRNMVGLHQLSKVYYKRANQNWENPQREVSAPVVEKGVPTICILLSKDPLDPQEPGYQPPRAPGVLPESPGALLSMPASPSPKHTAKRLCLDGQIESHL